MKGWRLLKKILLLIITAFLLMSGIPLISNASPLAYPTERLSGQDRVETALSIAQKGWNSAQTVILCEYSDYPDSIASTPFAASLDAPLLLTQGDSIDSRVVAELKRLKPQKVILLGGTGCLKPAIEKQLDQLFIKWERIGGADRYETSILLAKHINSDFMILANGDDFPDALSAASFAGVRQIPIVLTSKKTPDCVLQYYKEIQPRHLIVIGGEGIIPSAELLENNFKIETRLGGKDRYETNAKVISYAKDIYKSNDLFLASGLTFPDAVAGTALASKIKAPLLLTEKDDIPPAVYTLMREHMIIEPPLENDPNEPGEDLKKGKITAFGGLNLRETPSLTGKILLTIPNGTTINFIDQQNDWLKTTYQATTGWVADNYVIPSYPDSVDLSINGTVYILGGTGTISSNTQKIIEGKTSTKYPDNQRDFPPLPPKIKHTDSPSRGEDIIIDVPADGTENQADTIAYDPATEILIDPYQGIPANALLGKSILLDPGHGGKDPGAIGQTGSYEKINNLAIALVLREILTKAGAEVILTREKDISPAINYSVTADLQARVDLAAEYNPDLFISIHNNAALNSELKGTSVYYSLANSQYSESQKLADKILSSVIKIVGTSDLGVRTANFYVIANTSMPAVLIEAAFISNPYEEARLQNDTFRKNLAAAIFHGIYNYCK
ncbi:MAG: N-acetylmuramoyl-L-alanine amidase [Desulfitobacteriaceae bacterium]|nr:N-acetylmuramoyl-L-alanine amidase [Desulfitobacteriaceae bacterium]